MSGEPCPRKRKVVNEVIKGGPFNLRIFFEEKKKVALLNTPGWFSASGKASQGGKFYSINLESICKLDQTSLQVELASRRNGIVTTKKEKLHATQILL